MPLWFSCLSDESTVFFNTCSRNIDRLSLGWAPGSLSAPCVVQGGCNASRVQLGRWHSCTVITYSAGKLFLLVVVVPYVFFLSTCFICFTCFFSLQGALRVQKGWQRHFSLKVFCWCKFRAKITCRNSVQKSRVVYSQLVDSMLNVCASPLLNELSQKFIMVVFHLRCKKLQHCPLDFFVFS